MFLAFDPKKINCLVTTHARAQFHIDAWVVAAFWSSDISSLWKICAYGLKRANRCVVPRIQIAMCIVRAICVQWVEIWCCLFMLFQIESLQSFVLLFLLLFYYHGELYRIKEASLSNVHAYVFGSIGYYTFFKRLVLNKIAVCHVSCVYDGMHIMTSVLN